MHTIAFGVEGAAIALMVVAFVLRAFRIRGMPLLFVYTDWSTAERWLVLIAFAFLLAGLFLDGQFPIVGG